MWKEEEVSTVVIADFAWLGERVGREVSHKN